jgi:hypothetical protein
MLHTLDMGPRRVEQEAAFPVILAVIENGDVAGAVPRGLLEQPLLALRLLPLPLRFELGERRVH